MATKTLKPATINKDLHFKFGKSLAKGEQVLIQTDFVGSGIEQVEKFTAMRKEGDTLQYGIDGKDFTFEIEKN